MNMDELTEAEKQIIDAYRSMNKEGRNALLFTANGFKGSVQFQARFTVKDGIAYISANGDDKEGVINN